eukprot:344974-Chlamydomonas_euryale.AAC.3
MGDGWIGGWVDGRAGGRVCGWVLCRRARCLKCKRRCLSGGGWGKIVFEGRGYWRLGEDIV